MADDLSHEIPTTQASFDLTTVPPATTSDPVDLQTGKVRFLLAVILALTFLGTIGFSFWGAMLGDTTWGNVKEWLQAVLPAVTAVVSTAVGFYFGTQQNK